jgi:hypothetical protein
MSTEKQEKDNLILRKQHEKNAREECMSEMRNPITAKAKGNSRSRWALETTLELGPFF